MNTAAPSKWSHEVLMRGPIIFKHLVQYIIEICQKMLLVGVCEQRLIAVMGAAFHQHLALLVSRATKLPLNFFLSGWVGLHCFLYFKFLSKTYQNYTFMTYVWPTRSL